LVDAEWAKFRGGVGFAEAVDASGNALPEPKDWGPGFDGTGFWAQEKLRHLYPNLAAAARIVYGHPASAAAIERDFGRAGHLLTPERSLMDASFAEMVLLLNANQGSAIPSNLSTVPELKRHPVSAHRHERVPPRLSSMKEISKSISISTQLTLRQRGDSFELQGPGDGGSDSEDLEDLGF
jgi:hypothetical protein